MKKLLALTFAFSLPLPAIADAHQDRATRVETLSRMQSDQADKTMKSHIDLEMCTITFVFYVMHPEQHTIEAVVVSAELEEMSMSPVSEGRLSWTNQHHRFGYVGLISFELYLGASTSTHGDVLMSDTTATVLARPLISQLIVPRWTHFLPFPPNSTHMETLAAEIQSYKQDFCSPNT